MEELRNENITGLIEKFLEGENLSPETKRARQMVLMSFKNWLRCNGYKSIGV